jgi:hypothetical protein
VFTVDVTVHEIAGKLPSIAAVRDRSRALAMLSLLLSPDAKYGRAYSYDSEWRPNEELASRDNGAGDNYSIVFSPAGSYLRGFDHVSEMSPYSDACDGEPWPGVLDSVPEVFRHYIHDPEFLSEDFPTVTACLWRETADSAWRTGTITFPVTDPTFGSPDGADFLFDALVRSAEDYQDWASAYYDRPVDLEAVRAIFDVRPLTSSLAAAVNPDVSLADLAKDIAKIGYPSRP